MNAQNRKERIVLDFIHARFNGNTTMVKSLASPDFSFHATPYVGLGIETVMRHDSLLIRSISPSSPLVNALKVNDQIIEINKKNISSSSDLVAPFNGPIGKPIQLVVQSKDSSGFREYSSALTPIRDNQSLSSFLQDIELFHQSVSSSKTHIQNFFSKRNQVVIQYEWEGVKKKTSFPIMYSIIEIYEINPINKTVNTIHSQWSEKQLIDQIKGME